MLTCFAADGLPAFVLGCALLGLGAGLIEPTIASAALERAPEELHDRAMGAVIVALFLGQFLNPLVLQPLRQIGGVDLAFLVVGGAYATAGVLFGLAALHRRRLSARKNA